VFIRLSKECIAEDFAGNLDSSHFRMCNLTLFNLLLHSMHTCIPILTVLIGKQRPEKFRYLDVCMRFKINH